MNSLFAVGMPGGMELILIFAVILLLFGGTKLPALAKGLGQSIKEFKKAQRDEDEPKTKATPSESSANKQ